MIDKKEYGIAYKEVLEILKHISDEEYKRIPREKIELFETQADNQYKFEYNPKFTLDEQHISKRAKAIIAILFRDYWATDIQKEKIIAKQNYDRAKAEEYKKLRYNVNIFQNRNNFTFKQNIEYANAYSEVLEILKFIPKSDYEKIDKETINVFKINQNKEHVFNYNPNKTLTEQNVSKIAKIIIAILFRDYWATEKQREKILAKEKYDIKKEEEAKRERYNSNYIKKNKHTEQNSATITNLPIEVKKENLFKRLMSFIKNLIEK